MVNQSTRLLKNLLKAQNRNEPLFVSFFQSLKGRQRDWTYLNNIVVAMEECVEIFPHMKNCESILEIMRFLRERFERLTDSNFGFGDSFEEGTHTTIGASLASLQKVSEIYTNLSKLIDDSREQVKKKADILESALLKYRENPSKTITLKTFLRHHTTATPFMQKVITLSQSSSDPSISTLKELCREIMAEKAREVIVIDDDTSSERSEKRVRGKTRRTPEVVYIDTSSSDASDHESKAAKESESEDEEESESDDTTTSSASSPRGRSKKRKGKKADKETKKAAKQTKTGTCAKKLANFQPRSGFNLERYQKKPAEILKNQKGLLLMYETGSGKTMTSIHCAFTLLDEKRVNRVIFVVLANSEKECNFNKEILQFLHTKGQPSYPWLNLDENCSSLKEEVKMCIVSHNMFFERYSSSKSDAFRKYIQQKGTMIVVDEAHVMANALDSKKDKETKLPKPSTSSVILHACTKATKVLLLTATPFRNQIQDLYPLYLALTNEYVDLDFKYSKEKTKNALVRIKHIAVEMRDSQMNKKVYRLNPTQFQLRFRGLILFKENDLNDFAVVKYVDDQYEEHDDYYNVRTKKWNVVTCMMTEEETNLMNESKIRKNKSFFNEDQDEDLIHCFLSESFLATAMVNKLAHFAASQFRKLEEILGFYQHNAFPMILYCQYIEHGVREIRCFLNKLSLAEFGDSNSSSSSSSSGRSSVGSSSSSSSESSPKRVFAIITGKTKNRQEIVKAFNDGKVDIIILSDAGATGTDLRGRNGVRQIHIMNISWSPSQISQTVGRGWRKGAHASLAEEDRKLLVFIYLSTTHGSDVPDEVMMSYVSSKKVISDEIRALSRKFFDVKNLT